MYKCLDLAWQFHIGDDLECRPWMGQGPVSDYLVAVACLLQCPSSVVVLYPKTCAPLGSSESFTENVCAHTVLFYAFSNQCSGSSDEWCGRNLSFLPFLSAPEAERGLCRAFLQQIFFLSLSRTAKRNRHDGE